MKRALREVVVCREGTEWEAPGYGQEGVLYVTDRAELAAALAEKGLPVLGILNENGRDASFGKTRFLAEQGQDLTEDYLERVYRRYAGLPWEILETERCILRETVEEDVEAFYRIYGEPSITRFFRIRRKKEITSAGTGKICMSFMVLVSGPCC